MSDLCDEACLKSLGERTTLENGVEVIDIKKGSGAKPVVGYQVVLSYVAMTPEGRVFDSSFEKNKTYDIRCVPPHSRHAAPTRCRLRVLLHIRNGARTACALRESTSRPSAVQGKQARTPRGPAGMAWGRSFPASTSASRRCAAAA